MVSNLLLTPSKVPMQMNTLPAARTYVIEEPFDRALKLVRHALEIQELSIAGEFDVTKDIVTDDSFERLEPSRLLLVDSPLLLFEALALDRAAGVFVPVHVLVSADGDSTQVVCVEPASLFEARLPVGASQPLADLRRRVTMALESLVPQSVPHRSRRDHL
jgi:uncharacterized protein (DUF302 family)